MESETTTEGVVNTPNNEGEGETTQSETVTISKADYDKQNQTLGSLKRELKDLKKAREEASKETSTTNTKLDDNRLLERLEKMSLRAAGITHEDDANLARSLAKKWNMEVDEVILDEDFKSKLERQRTGRDNAQATSGVKGSAGQSQAKNTSEYWKAKGTPPTPAEVPDLKVRAKIIREMMVSAKNSGKKFYND